jgi:hypothetical protein
MVGEDRPWALSGTTQLLPWLSQLFTHRTLARRGRCSIANAAIVDASSLQILPLALSTKTMPSSSSSFERHWLVEREEQAMIRGLQITMQGSNLHDRIAEQVRIHEAAIATLDARIARREGDLSFDIRPDDGFETLGELQAERQTHRDSVRRLTLVRDSVVQDETYTLDKSDLRLAGLIAADAAMASEVSHDLHVVHSGGLGGPIDGLKLTMSGMEVRALVEQRIAEHRRRAEHWKRERARTPEEQTEDEPLLPEHMCANEAERHEWRAKVLTFIHDHLDVGQVYRIAEADLAFAELLPEKPGWLEQDEYEERTRVGFELERLTKHVGGLIPGRFALMDPAED